MYEGFDGVHEVVVNKDLKGFFYTYLIDGVEVTDPYSRAASINSKKSAIVDLDETNPPGWNTHTIPYNKRNCDAIVYEVHIKDFTVSPSSGAINRGKYLGFVEKDTKYKNVKTGLSHLKEIGVTHIHIMPTYDFITVKEEKELFLRDDNYNWGYDPELYNVPEGSYSLYPEDPVSRIKELKTMIMDLHEEGFKVILDVVYNHTYKTLDSNFNVIMPNYFYRNNPDGSFSNGSGVGNEIASERPMVRKFIIDSLLYWVNEYKVDGFRFDLMALIDIDTVEEAIETLRQIKPDIFIYGEPWTGGITALSDTKTTTKGTQGKMSFALFNDNFRDALKGNNDGDSKGFIQGNLDFKNAVETGIAGSIYYDHGHIGFASHPRETINYINSHDNLILADKIRAVFPKLDKSGQERLNKFALSILLTSQGIPFIHAGNEFLRSKDMNHNTYNSPLSINAIDWSLKERNIEFFNYFKELIELRMTYKAFRMTSVDVIRNRLKFMKNPSPCSIIAYTLELSEDKYLLLVHNANPYDCIINSTAIKEHLLDSHGFKWKGIVRKIFDENGLLDEKEINLESSSLDASYFATLVYELT